MIGFERQMKGKKGAAGWCDKTNNYWTKTTQEKQMKGEKNNDPASKEIPQFMAEKPQIVRSHFEQVMT